MIAVAEIGNKKAKAFWECRLPEDKRPGVDASPSGIGRMSESCLVWASFLKQKYIQRLWIPMMVK